MKKIERLQAILQYIQTKRTVRAEDLSVRFDVNIRTIYRDVNALIEAGMPIGAEAGRGYFLLEGHYLSPLMFTKDEALALLLAGKFFENKTAERFQQAFSSAAEKISSQLRGELKDEWAALQERIKVNTLPLVNEANGERWLDAINRALAGSLVVFAHYKTGQQASSTRQIEPIGLLYYSNTWHLIGWCRLRKDYRDFRLDRISELTCLEEQFDSRRRISITDYVEHLHDHEDWQEVRIFVDDTTYPYLQNMKRVMGFVSEEKTEGGYTMLFAISSIDYFARWLLMPGNGIRIISPDALREQVIERVKQLQEQYLL